MTRKSWAVSIARRGLSSTPIRGLPIALARAGGVSELELFLDHFKSALADGTVDTWDTMYKVNVRTAVIACQAALPYLLQAGGGRIVNVGAMGAMKAATGMGAYAASKAGVAKLTEALAEEMKDRGVTVNAILPSTLDTPKNRRDMPQADFTRWVAPAEAAEVIAFLVSDEARAVTGALIPVVGRV